MATLREASEAAMKTASELFERTGSVSPIWLIEMPEGENDVIVSGEFTGNASKNAIAAAIREKFGGTATRIIFISEAWIREMKGPYDGIAPSEHPDRIEVIHLVGEDRDGGQVSISRTIDRSSGTAKLLPPEVSEGTIFRGRLASFFQRPATTH
jgi:hypothetical protein